jgi:hypothetical protein
MRYGFYLPTRGPTATRDGILALAREGERLGFHSAMIADHIVLPVESQSTYPYTLDGRHPSAGDALETFSILGVVAGATERLAARHLRAGVALPESGADCEDGGLAGCLVRRPAHLGSGRRLAEGRVRGAEQPRLQCTRRGNRRVDRDLQTALVPVARQLQWPLLPILRYPVRTIPGAETVPANLGRRAFSRRSAAHRPVWRWLAPSRRRRRLAVTAKRCARISTP